MMELLQELEHTRFSQWVTSDSILAFPTILLLHTYGMGILVGLMTAIDLVKDRARQVLDPARRDQVVQAAFHQGLLLLGCGESAIRFCPPLCITAPQIDTALASSTCG